MRACKTCRYAVPEMFLEGMESAGYYGSCHRYPPFRKVIDDNGTFEGYNAIFDDDWCGEWSAKTKEQNGHIAQQANTAICPVSAMQCVRARVVVECQTPDAPCQHRGKQQ